jgi:hypothetical protein
MTYSLASPLVLPLRTDLTICGSHINEYETATNIIERVGERMTRTMNVRKTNNITPDKLNNVRLKYNEGFERKHGPYITLLGDLSGRGE